MSRRPTAAYQAMTTMSDITATTQATLVEADQWEAEALDLISIVQTPEEAEHLLAKTKLAEQAVQINKLGAERQQRWARIRLLATRRYGELLPPRRPGKRTSDTLSKADQKASERARKVSEVPPEVFAEYVQNPQPTLSGLLRYSKAKASADPTSPKKAIRRSGPPLWEDIDVLAWVAKRMRAGRTRDEIFAECEAGEHHWPHSGQKLTQNGVDICRAILRDRELRGDEMPKRRRRSGQRLREISEMRKATHSDLIDIQWRIVRMTRELETTNVESYILDADGDTAETMKLLADDLIELQAWMNRTTSSVWARLKDADKIEKIRKLRDTTGRTPAEAATALALADELQRKLDRGALVAT